MLLFNQKADGLSRQLFQIFNKYKICSYYSASEQVPKVTWQIKMRYNLWKYLSKSIYIFNADIQFNQAQISPVLTSPVTKSNIIVIMRNSLLREKITIFSDSCLYLLRSLVCAHNEYLRRTTRFLLYSYLCLLGFF